MIAKTRAEAMLKLKSILFSRRVLPACAHTALCLTFIALVLFQSFTLHAQPSVTNQVLELDGNGGYVELPPNIFKDLEEATIECWLRWESSSSSISSRDAIRYARTR